MNKLGIPILAPAAMPAPRPMPTRHGNGGQRHGFDQALDRAMEPPAGPDDGPPRDEPMGRTDKPERADRPERPDRPDGTDDREPTDEVDDTAVSDDSVTADSADGPDEAPDLDEAESAGAADDVEGAEQAETADDLGGEQPVEVDAPTLDETADADELPVAVDPAVAEPVEQAPAEAVAVTDMDGALASEIAEATVPTVDTAAETPTDGDELATSVSAEQIPQTTMATAADAAETTTAAQATTTAEAPTAAETAAATVTVDEPEPSIEEATLELHADGDAAPVAPTPTAAGAGLTAGDAEVADGAPMQAQADAAPIASGADPLTADAAPTPESTNQPRPATPVTVAPVGSTQATVEVAAARAEQVASPAGAQQASAAATPEGADAPELWRQVQRAVGSLRTNADGDQQMTIRLRPAELGAVIVRVIANETGTNVSVVAETSAAANQLSQQRQQLTSELESSGLRGVSVDIGAETGDGQAARDASETDGDGDGNGSGLAGQSGERAAGLANDFGFNRRLRPLSGRPQLIDLDL